MRKHIIILAALVAACSGIAGTNTVVTGRAASEAWVTNKITQATNNINVGASLTNGLASVAFVTNAVAAHTNRTNNPHGVTAAQVGALTASDTNGWTVAQHREWLTNETDAAALAALATNMVMRLQNADGKGWMDATGVLWSVYGIDTNQLVIVSSNVDPGYEANVGTSWIWDQYEGPAYCYTYGGGMDVTNVGKVQYSDPIWILQLFNDDSPVLIGGASPSGTFTGSVGSVTFEYAHTSGDAVTASVNRVLFDSSKAALTNDLLNSHLHEAEPHGGIYALQTGGTLTNVTLDGTVTIGGVTRTSWPELSDTSFAVLTNTQTWTGNSNTFYGGVMIETMTNIPLVVKQNAKETFKTFSSCNSAGTEKLYVRADGFLYSQSTVASPLFWVYGSGTPAAPAIVHVNFYSGISFPAYDLALSTMSSNRLVVGRDGSVNITNDNTWLAANTVTVRDMTVTGTLDAKTSIFAPITNLPVVADGATNVVTVSADKRIYVVTATNTLNTITNVLGTASFGGSNATWEIWVDFTNPLGTNMTWCPCMQFDVVPEITATGLYKFACSSYDGKKALTRQTWPDTQAYVPLYPQAVWGGDAYNGSGDNRLLTLGTKQDGLIQYLWPARTADPVMVSVVAAAAITTGTAAGAFGDWKIEMYNGNVYPIETNRCPITSLSSNVGGPAIMRNYIVDATDTVASSMIRLRRIVVPGDTLSTNCNMVVSVLCRPLTRNERAAYDAGWRP